MEDSALNRYLDEIGREQLLTNDEERQLAERIAKGDERALSKLIEANLKFVVTIARQYKGKGVDMEDLVSEGNIGLMKAAAKFDASKGVRFVNFAVVSSRVDCIRCQRTLSRRWLASNRRLYRLMHLWVIVPI